MDFSLLTTITIKSEYESEWIRMLISFCPSVCRQSVSQSVCLSVCLSQSRIVPNGFSTPAGPFNLVFLLQIWWWKSDLVSFNTRWLWEIRSWTNISLYMLPRKQHRIHIWTTDIKSYFMSIEDVIVLDRRGDFRGDFRPLSLWSWTSEQRSRSLKVIQDQKRKQREFRRYVKTTCACIHCKVKWHFAAFYAKWHTCTGWT